MALGLFRSGEVGKALDVAGSQLIAGMKDLTDRPSAGDEEVVAVVREEWCQCLVYPGLDKGALEGRRFSVFVFACTKYSYSSR